MPLGIFTTRRTMTLDRLISIASLLSLAYFAYGTWRIDRTLREVRDILDRTEDVLRSRLDDPRDR